MPKTIVFIIIQIFFAERTVWKIGEYCRLFSSFSCDVTCLNQSCLMDYKLLYNRCFRSMCTVSAFFSVKCASGNYQILKDVISKSQWSQTACCVPSYGDVCNENLRPDQIWKKLSRNWNQLNDLSLLHCYFKLHVSVSDYPCSVCIIRKQS